MGKKEKVVDYMERIKQAIIGARRYSTSQGSLVTKAPYKDTERAIKAVEPIVAEIQAKLEKARGGLKQMKAGCPSSCLCDRCKVANRVLKETADG